MNFGLSDRTVDQLCAVLGQFPQIERAVLYGSRAKGNFKPGSDIDLSLFGDALTPALCATVADVIDELLLPYTVDLSVFSQLNHPELEAHIERVGQVFYQRQESC